MGFPMFDPSALYEDEEERKRKLREAELRHTGETFRNELGTIKGWEDAEGRAVGGPRSLDQDPGSTRGGGDRESAYDPVQRGLDVAGGTGNDYLDKYAAHLSRKPKPSDYEPSTLRKILSVIGGTAAGAAGLNPAQVTRGLAYGKYGKAMADWQAEGEGLGDVAALEEQHARSRRTLGGRVLTADVKRVGDVEDYNLGQARVGVDAANLEVRKQELEEKIRHAKTTEERDNAKLELDRVNVALRRAEHALDVEEFEQGQHEFDVESGLEERDVSTRERRGEAYGKNVDSLVESRANREKEGYGSQLTPTQNYEAQQLAIRRAIEENPEWKQYYDQDLGIISDDEGWFWDSPAPPEFKKRVKDLMEQEYPGGNRRTRWYGDVDPYGGGGE